MSEPQQISELLTVEDLARILRKSVHTIRHDLTRNPLSLPPRCDLPGTNRNLWRPQDVEAWLAAHVVTLPPPITTLPHKRRGAPTKAARIAKQQASARASA